MLLRHAQAEDGAGLNAYLWKLVRENGNWTQYALRRLSQKGMPRELSGDQYEVLRMLSNDESDHTRLYVGKVLGESYRWPNPLLMEMAIAEHGEIRAALLAYLSGAAGLNPIEGSKLADHMASVGAELTEEQVRNAIKDAKEK